MTDNTKLFIGLIIGAIIGFLGANYLENNKKPEEGFYLRIRGTEQKEHLQIGPFDFEWQD